jgi:hypothetical protein
MMYDALRERIHRAQTLAKAQIGWQSNDGNNKDVDDGKQVEENPPLSVSFKI